MASKEEKKEDRIFYTPLINMNKSVYMLGLTPLQLAFILPFVIVLFVLLKLMALVVIVPLIIATRKIRNENKSGNPGYVDSIANYMQGKKYMVDKKRSLKYLERSRD